MDFYISKENDLLVGIDGDDIYEFERLDEGEAAPKKRSVRGARASGGNPGKKQAVLDLLDKGMAPGEIVEELSARYPDIIVSYVYSLKYLSKKTKTKPSSPVKPDNSNAPRLLPDKIREIKARINQGDELDVIAEDFNVPVAAVAAFKRKMTPNFNDDDPGDPGEA